MSRSRKTGIIIWVIAFALSVFLMFLIPDHYSTSIYAVLIFDCFAFISQLLLWISLSRDAETPREIFLASPAMILSAIYLAIQFVLCVAIGFAQDVVPFRVVLIINVLLAAIMWIVIIVVMRAKDYAQRIDSRQKNHHVEL